MAVQEKLGREARRIQIKGKVQGVGFRPFVYRLAHRFGLLGQVSNGQGGVIIEIEGDSRLVEAFTRALSREAPPLASLSRISTQTISHRGFTGFTIAATDIDSRHSSQVPLPPDTATCGECFAEIMKTGERRHMYPFTNCTNCGPRFTIARGLPYDRGKTTMAPFPLCSACLTEYREPRDRRFHAQPIACPECGPRIQAVGSQGEELRGSWHDIARLALQRGEIIALKGLGGFHLACDAANPWPVRRLRRLKQRGAKPFAVMAQDLQRALHYCCIDADAAALLTSPAAPIVTCLKKAGSSLPVELAPGLQTLGVMLPYTPLHLLLFGQGIDLLVMTSGNRGGLPLAIDNDAALKELQGVADIFLLHDREIARRCDDSVALPPYARGKEKLPAILLRRSRGYVPDALPVPGPALQEAVAGFGAEMKNTFCVLRGSEAHVSQHQGDMSFLEGRRAFRESYDRWCSLLSCEPVILGYDPHPGYALSQMALQYPWLARYPVQHHHAHMAAVMAEHRLEEKVLAAILDGSGYGLDGNMWGFEILAGDFLDFQRLYHMRYLPLPGNETAVKEPWRTALALLYQGGGEKEALEVGMKLFKGKDRELALTLGLLKSGFNTPLASSGGRLFDAAAALLGLCLENSYEGEGAMRVSDRVLSAPGGAKVGKLPCYPYKIKGSVIDFSPIAREMADEALAGKDKTVMAWKFHHTLARALTELLLLGQEKTGLRNVILGGGVFQNRVLLLLCKNSLEAAGFQVFFSAKIPPNDGGLSVGQALVAAWRRWHDVPGYSCTSPSN